MGDATTDDAADYADLTVAKEGTRTGDGVNIESHSAFPNDTPRITIDYVDSSRVSHQLVEVAVQDAAAYSYDAPEPATLSLLALGGLAMLRRRGLRR